jgi:hypothetical protein
MNWSRGLDIHWILLNLKRFRATYTGINLPFAGRSRKVITLWARQCCVVEYPLSNYMWQPSFQTATHRGNSDHDAAEPAAIERLLRKYLDRRIAGKELRPFLARHSNTELRSWLAGAEVEQQHRLRVFCEIRQGYC